MSVARIWTRLFLEQRPSLCLGLFRIALAIAIGLHAIPTLLQMQDNYFSTAFKEKNGSFFPLWALKLVEASPDWLVWCMAAAFLLFWFFFLIGLFTQISGVLMTAGLYYFYAMNSLHIGTLSFDILLVTVFLMLITPYPGDYFSVDALRRPNRFAYKRERPYFVQRLLQIQIASVFLYTCLGKWTAGGNWLSENPFYFLCNSPDTNPLSVVKDYPLRSYFAGCPRLCYSLGATLLIFEFLLPFLLFVRKTRLFAIGMGIAFHAMLVITLHVPTLFFFQFPPQLLLFADPRGITQWIDKRRARHRALGRAALIYDGDCGFCRASLRPVMAMDMFGVLKKVNYHTVQDLSGLHAQLTRELCHSQMYLLETDGRLYGGYAAFRRLTLRLPMLWPLAPLAYFPGMTLPGNWAYRWVARNRGLMARWWFRKP